MEKKFYEAPGSVQRWLKKHPKLNPTLPTLCRLTNPSCLGNCLGCIGINPTLYEAHYRAPVEEIYFISGAITGYVTKYIFSSITGNKMVQYGGTLGITTLGFLFASKLTEQPYKLTTIRQTQAILAGGLIGTLLHSVTNLLYKRLV